MTATLAENPYSYSPGSSSPGPEVSPAEGQKDLWGYFWLSIASTVIITVAGLIGYFAIH